MSHAEARGAQSGTGVSYRLTPSSSACGQQSSSPHLPGRGAGEDAPSAGTRSGCQGHGPEGPCLHEPPIQRGRRRHLLPTPRQEQRGASSLSPGAAARAQTGSNLIAQATSTPPARHSCQPLPPQIGAGGKHEKGRRASPAAPASAISPLMQESLSLPCPLPAAPLDLTKLHLKARFHFKSPLMNQGLHSPPPSPCQPHATSPPQHGKPSRDSALSQDPAGASYNPHLCLENLV